MTRQRRITAYLDALAAGRRPGAMRAERRLLAAKTGFSLHRLLYCRRRMAEISFSHRI